MKKLLALVLALVMTLGLATVGANAAYADQDDINYEEAVAVMSAIGVLAGDETGFRPADTLKRSEGAKIVAYLLLGNKAAEAMVGTGAKFTDLPANHWAAGYMEYLASQGVMGGVGGGKIDPDGQLTATAFAKMLLVALGYDAEIEGFGGDDWSINVQKVANQVGIFSGNRNAAPNAAVTREEAALYAFNTIKSPLVHYTNKGSSVEVNGAKIAFGASEAEYVISNTKSEQTISDDKLVNSSDENPRYIVEFAEKYYPDLRLVGLGVSYNDFGQPVYKWTNANVAVGTFVAKTGLVATYTKKVSAKDLYDLLGKDRYDSLVNDNTSLQAWQDGVRVAVVGKAAGNGSAATVDPFLNRSNTNAVNGSANGVVTEIYLNEDNDVNIVSYHTWVFQAVGDYNATTQTVSLTQAGDTQIMLNSSRLSVVDFPEIEALKGDDYVLVTATHDSTTSNWYEVQSVAKAKVVTGTVETYSYDTTYNVTIDGTKYDYSATTSYATDEKVQRTRYTVGKQAAIVLDKYDYIIAVDSAIVTNDYVFITEFGGSAGLTRDADPVAAAIFPDGTNATIKIKSAWDYTNAAQVDTKTTISGWHTATYELNDHEFKWYTFSKDSSGYYTLYPVLSGYSYTDGYYNYTGGTSTKNTFMTGDKVAFIEAGADQAIENTGAASNITTKYPANATGIYTANLNAAYTPAQTKANDNTVVIVEDEDGDISVFTGIKNLPTLTLNAANTAVEGGGKNYLDGNEAAVHVVYKDSNQYASLVYVKLYAGADVDGQNENLVYVVKFKSAAKDADGETVYTYVALDENGEEIDIKADRDISNNMYATYGAGANNIYHAASYVRKNADDVMTSFYSTTAKAAANWVRADDNNNPISFSAGTLSIGGAGYPVKADTKVTLIAMGSNVTGINAGGSAAVLNSDKSAAYKAYIVSPEQLANTLKGYSATYDYTLRKTSTTNATIEELFVTVKDLTVVTNLTAASYSPANLTAAIRGALANTKARVTVSGDTTLTGVSTIIIDSDDVLTLSGTNGDLTVNDGTTLYVDGTLNVDGDIVVNDGGEIRVRSGGQLVQTAGGTQTGNVIYGDSLVVDSGAKKVELKNTVGTTVYGHLTLNAQTAILGALTIKEGGTLATTAKVIVADSDDVITWNGSNPIVIGTDTTSASDGNVTVEGNAEINSLVVIDGNLTIEEDSAVELKASANVEVAGNATVNEVVTAANAAELDVAGTITANSTEAKASIAKAVTNAGDDATSKVDVAVDSSATTIPVTLHFNQPAIVKDVAKGTSDSYVKGDALELEGKKGGKVLLEITFGDSTGEPGSSALNFTSVYTGSDVNTPTTCYYPDGGSTAAATGSYQIPIAGDASAALDVYVGTPTYTVSFTRSGLTASDAKYQYGNSSSAATGDNDGSSNTFAYKAVGTTAITNDSVQVPYGAYLKVTAVKADATDKWAAFTLSSNAAGFEDETVYDVSAVAQSSSGIAFTTIPQVTEDVAFSITATGYDYEIKTAGLVGGNTAIGTSGVAMATTYDTKNTADVVLADTGVWFVKDSTTTFNVVATAKAAGTSGETDTITVEGASALKDGSDHLVSIVSGASITSDASETNFTVTLKLANATDATKKPAAGTVVDGTNSITLDGTGWQ